MRIIKFRVWDNEKNKYIYTSLSDICDDFGFEYSLDDNASDFCNIIKFFGGRPEQFTGLKDKYGEEIYEGDIVTISTPIEDWNSIVEYLVDTKVYDGSRDNRATGFFLISEGRASHLSSHGCLSIEVIGNIHENPELLKNK